MAKDLSSFVLINKITQKLLEPENARIQKRSLDFIQKNADLIKNPNSYGFIYQGIRYSRAAPGVAMRVKMDTVHRSLVEELQQFHSDRRLASMWEQKIRQAFALMFDQCCNLQDVRDTLPNCVVELIKDLKAIPRQRPEAWSLDHNPSGQRHYQAVKERIEFYAVTHYIY